MTGPGGDGPARTCIACRTTRPARELTRIGLDPAGGLRVGPGPGRGAWLCPDPDCFTRGVKREPLRRSLRRPVTREEVDALRATMAQALGRRLVRLGGATAGRERVN